MYLALKTPVPAPFCPGKCALQHCICLLGPDVDGSVCPPQASPGQSHHRGVQTESAVFCVHHKPMQVNQQSTVRPLWLSKCKAILFFLLFFYIFRVQYCSQEIIIFREDLVNKMCRNCVRLPNDNLDIPNHVSYSSSEKTFIPKLKKSQIITKSDNFHYFIVQKYIYIFLSYFLSSL